MNDLNTEKISKDLEDILVTLYRMEDSVRDTAMRAETAAKTAAYQHLATHLEIAHGILCHAQSFVQLIAPIEESK